MLFASLSLPISFNACGQQSYDVALQPLANGSLSDGDTTMIDSDPNNDSSSTDNMDAGNQTGGNPDNTGSNNQPPAGDPNNEPLPPSYQAMKQSITVSAQNKTDILIVEDDSGSMSFEQLSMASRFSSFIGEIKNLDWQLGITTTDVSADKTGKDGRLLSFRDSKGQYNYGSVLTSKMDGALVDELFKNTIQRSQTEVGSPNEQGIFATYRFLERYFDLSDNNISNRQLLRDAATLAVIFVTDADESPTSGTATERNKGENLKNYIRTQLGSSKRFSFHSIIVKQNDNTCLTDKSTFALNGKNYTNGNEAFGTAYAGLSKDTGGLIGSVCESDYGTQLKEIGKLVADSVKTANLSCTPLDLDKDGIPDVKATGPMGENLMISSIKDSIVTFMNDLPLGNTSIEYTCLAK